MGSWKLVVLVSISAMAFWSDGCSRSPTTRVPAQAPAEDTTLGAGDVFEIRVFGEKDLSGKYQVAPDGSIRYPFLGPVMVGGKEVWAIEREIAQGLKDGHFLLDPQVSIFVETTNSRRVSVLGAIARPGTFPLVPGLTVVQAVSNAGGFTPLASKDDTVVTRRVDGKLERYRIAVSEVTRGNADDFPLRAGDLVFVPERVF
ncbi:MAG: Capsular polysaccharide synthesis enzyme CpsC, polysaccharide export [Myxococcaceae bacterium]|nr:Capsular polysaccharide synthesis enzyme CpsC, polysaccharide export [Myxococcaceae bacterium]